MKDDLKALEKRIAALEADVAAIQRISLIKLNLGTQAACDAANAKRVRPAADKAIHGPESDK